MLNRIRKHRITSSLVTVAAMASLVTACSGHPAPSGSTQSDKLAVATTPPAPDRVTLVEGIAKLKTEPEDNAPTYERELFPHWTDKDGDGCDARREVLIAEAIEKPSVDKEANCSLTGGTWASYFDDVIIDNADDMTVDHMVPLAEAWRSGASGWDEDTRTRFANDAGYAYSLVGVTRQANSSKSDQDPASWMPQNQKCRYLLEWVSVKLRWGLSADPEEMGALKTASAKCSSAPLVWQKADVKPLAELRPH
jgi:hypothetical protein